MANIEEQVKAFLSDEKKTEALANDDAFMEKISAGTATPKIISEKFGELGLQLSENESKEILDKTQKILTKTNITEVSSPELDEISGGGWTDTASNIGYLVGGVGAASALGCTIVRAIYNGKAKKAADAGNIKLSHDYTDTATALGIASKACAGLGAAGMGAGIGFGLAAKSSQGAKGKGTSGLPQSPEWYYNPLYQGK